MAFKDILVALTSYPEPTPVFVVDSAISVAAALGAHIAAVSCETHVEIPGHFLAGSIVNSGNHRWRDCKEPNKCARSARRV
jgi:hypothetical protein